jgi:hypothetical protein
MDRRKLWWSSLLLVLLVGAEAYAQQSPTIVAGRRECPHSYGKFGGMLESEVVSTDVPEFNDCQRFLIRDSVGGGLIYGEYFAIFATNIAKTLVDSLGKYEEYEEDRLPPPTRSGLVGFSAAVVLAYGDYKPLGIRAGLNCLVVWREGSDNWRAKMVPRGATQEGTCAGIIDPASVIGRPLSVVRRGAGVEADYPAVARWDWDDRNGWQVAGITCSNAWCNVGSRGFFGFQPSITFHEREGNPTVSPGRQSVTDIKGWYDEQYLAAVQAVGDAARPTEILGTVIPDPLLGSTSTTQRASDRDSGLHWEVRVHGNSDRRSAGPDQRLSRRWMPRSRGRD